MVGDCIVVFLVVNFYSDCGDKKRVVIFGNVCFCD